MREKEKDTLVPLGYWPTKVEPTIPVSELRSALDEIKYDPCRWGESQRDICSVADWLLARFCNGGGE